jgi:putative sterol carrier protein
MLESSYRKIQRVIAKSPLWRSYGDVDMLLHALESRGIHLFEGLMLNFTGRFLLASMLRDKREEIYVETSSEIGGGSNDPPPPLSLVVSNDETDEKKGTQESSPVESNKAVEEAEEEEETSAQAKKEKVVVELKKEEDKFVPIWADLDIIVKDGGNNTLNLGIYLSDWNDIVVGTHTHTPHILLFKM